MALVVIVTVMHIAVAAALPLWSTALRRDREEELIFRGLQYAEAIRVFKLRHGRDPVRVEELLEVEPRSIRRLWRDPMTEAGGWALVFALQPGTGAAGQTSQQGDRRRRRGAETRPPRQPSLGERGPADGELVQVGPIRGVHSKSDETALKSFFGAQQYDQWQFIDELITLPQIGPEGTLPAPRVGNLRIGRPLPPELGVAQGAAPGAAPPQRGAGGDADDDAASKL